MFDWDDIRIFIAAARAGSLATAGQKLGIDAATVGRRLARLETSLKSTLVVRSPQGLTLTAAGAQLLDTTQAAEQAMEAAEQLGRADPMSGTVRISAAEGFGGVVLAPALPEFLVANPGLKVELAAASGFLSASRREADIAITLSPAASARLIIEPLTPYHLALYASPHHPAALDPPKDLRALHDLDLVGYIDDLIFAPELNYLDEISPGLRPRVSSSSIRAQRDIICSGGGIGILPCFLAQDLVQILPDKVSVQRQFWLQTHKGIHNTVRMKKVSAWLKSICLRQAHILRPLQP